MTSDSNDPYDRQTEVSVELTETGLRASSNFRWLAALDALLGTNIAARGLEKERQVRVERARTDAYVKMVEAAATVAVEQLKVSPDLAGLALEGHVVDTVRKFENKRAVLLEAQEHLADGSEIIPGKGTDALDEDWLNFMASYAEKATSDTMRKMLGLILAGEVRRPGAFSISTLRVVAELSQEDARIFQGLVLHRFDKKAVLRNPETKVDPLGLETAGLIEGATAGMSQSFEGGPEKPAYITIGNRLVIAALKHIKGLDAC